MPSKFGRALVPAAFTPTAEDIAAWQHATTVLDFNGQANAGGGALTTGFTPDPWGFPLTAGGGRNPTNVADLNMRDEVTGRPRAGTIFRCSLVRC